MSDVSATTAVRIPSSGTLNGLLTCPQMLLEVTFDQLRTLVVVQEAGSAHGAARVLGREQSSVQKQIDTLNRAFQRMCGELLVVKQGRGQPFLFTPSGIAVAEQACALLSDWQAGVNDARRRIGKTVAIGTTEFTLPFVGKVWQRVADQFAAREIELNVLHVRTKDSFARLDAKEVDLLCGGFASLAGADDAGSDVPADYEFLQWRREGLVLLTNLPQRELPMPAVGVTRLPDVPLVVPSGGVIVDFLRRWYGNDFRTRLTITATIDDIYYGLALLRSKIAYGCMVVSAGIGQAAVDGRLPGGPDVRLVDLGPDFDPMLELVTGTFARRGERDVFDATHPLNLLWQAFADEIASGASYAL
ncbi:LysR family transcriptional regulator [Sphaerisporangium sp. B11E5]|uniref:LysR family transcriptional regulator n=1 Tax=Sphaerisporangium sp. B11E5 TaxID=3153563 RepID=UPI00325CD592